MMKKLKTPKAVQKAKPSQKLPLVSPVGLSPETESLLATLSQGEERMLRAVLEASARTKLPPKALLETYSTLGDLLPLDELIRIAQCSSEDLEAFGWKRVESWDGLFTLYKRGNRFVAEMSDRLLDIESSYRRANTKKGRNEAGIGDVELKKLQRALFCLNLRKKMGGSLGSLDAIILSDLTESIGAMVSEAWNYIPKKREFAVSLRAGSSDSGGSIRAVQLVRFFTRAVEGLMKLKYPTDRVKSSGAKKAKEPAAIEFARQLCGLLRRLPTKSEVRFVMEENDFSYSDERSRAASNWRNMFTRCGLEALKD